MDADYILKELRDIRAISIGLADKCESLARFIESEHTPVKQLFKPKLTKEQEQEALVEEIKHHMTMLAKGRILRDQFNLAVVPHISRTEEYLRTRDPKVFDRLKRAKKK
jgi:hypothetical protein